ncbi:LytR C-terminal domain-containing protein [Neoactinobaculum massilliense]|uniref:LytR C-terminal domain-containing protein n=1 Tax=Neoactinobaculum massilliense TaxID=2364794 RepID=UPI000F53B8BA|nr:LytR C-terminal domain-containing protein [Neoactinobaculum massilliense]
MSEPRSEARAAYRHKIQQRQTVFFSITGGILAVILVFAVLVWSGVMPAPIDREFSKTADPNALTIPCLEEGQTTAVPFDQLTANVYNSSAISGAASQVGKVLTEAGVKVGTTGNWSGTSLSESARVMAGPDGIQAAYTVAQFIPGSVVQYANDLSGETVNVVIGDAYEKVLTSDQVNQENPKGTLTSQKKCIHIK